MNPLQFFAVNGQKSTGLMLVCEPQNSTEWVFKPFSRPFPGHFRVNFGPFLGYLWAISGTSLAYLEFDKKNAVEK